MNARLYLCPGYLSEEKCRKIVDAMANATGYASVHEKNRTEIPAFNLRNLHPQEAYEILMEVRRDAIDRVSRFYGLTYPIWNEFTLLSDLHDGYHHALHADNERLEPDGRWAPNHTAWRSHTAMLYLNTSGKDFFGGHIRFTELAQDIPPKEGLLVGFECGRAFLHETTPVTEGHRYAVSLWMTSDKSHAEIW